MSLGFKRSVVAIAAWLGFALAALFLYPLADALDSGIYYLQWQHRDSIETFAALALLAPMFSVALYVVWPRRGRGATLALGLLAILPVMSFAAGLARQLPFGAELREAWEIPGLRFGVPGAVGLLVLLAFIKWPASFDRWSRGFLMVLSPVSLIVVATFIRSAAHPEPVVYVERESPPSVSTSGSRCAPVLALLFDELSFAYLYDGATVGADYPAIRRFAETAINYTAVRAPGPDTLTALPGYLTVRHDLNVRVEPTEIVAVAADGASRTLRATEADGLFATARRLGYGTEMAGYYFPYCALLGDLVDRCQSFSFYSASLTRAGFSPVNPILTTLILWPRQFPFGLVKNVAFARLQRRLVERTRAFAERRIDPSRPVFRFVHFSIPHLPFVFTADGFDPPFDALRTSPDTAFKRQIEYVDRLVGELVERMKGDGTFDRTTIVILSDHGFRFGGRERDPRHIPFIVKMAGQRTAEHVSEPQFGESLLPDVLTRSCALPPPSGP